MTHPLFSKIEELEAAILAKHPTMPTLLREIHMQIKKDPALVTVLSPEEISKIVRGLQAQTATTLAASVSKPNAAAKAKLKNVTAEDLGF
jgi:hypothetical protein